MHPQHQQRSSYHDNHDNASSTFPVGSNGTLETSMKKEDRHGFDDEHDEEHGR